MSASATAELVVSVAGEMRLSKEVVRQIVHKTDGMPFFAEELTRAIIEIGILDSVEDARAPEIVPALAIAATLHDSLMARLDRLAEAGGGADRRNYRPFVRPYKLLSAMAGREEPCTLDWRSLSGRTFSSATASRPTRATASSTRSSRTPPTGHCCGPLDKDTTVGSPPRWRDCPAIPSPSIPSSWPIITQKAACQSRPSVTSGSLARVPSRPRPMPRLPVLWPRPLSCSVVCQRAGNGGTRGDHALRLALGGAQCKPRPNRCRGGGTYRRARELCEAVRHSKERFTALWAYGSSTTCGATSIECRSLAAVAATCPRARRLGTAP